MGYGVFTAETRFTWVKGWLTGGVDPADGSVEVGAGTAFPLKLTIPQVEELYFRVRDARASGTITAVYSFAPTNPYNLSVSDGAMPVDFYSGTTSDVVTERSYADTAGPPQNVTDERVMWTGPLSTPTAPTPPASSPLVHSLVTGLTHYTESFVFPLSIYYPYGWETLAGIVNPVPVPASLEFAFGNRVAVTGDGNPLDPANEIWAEFSFLGYSINGMVFVYAYTLATGAPDEGETGNLTVSLPSGNITCQLYASNYSFLDSATSTMTITATEFWPYNRLDEPRSIWDAATGEFVPIGAPFASFSVDYDNSDLYLLLF